MFMPHEGAKAGRLTGKPSALSRKAGWEPPHEANGYFAISMGYPRQPQMSSTSLSGTRSKTATGARNIALMREGLTAWLATGGYLFRPYYLGLLAEACGKAGQVEEGLRLLAEALAAAHQTGERFLSRSSIG